MAADTHCFVCHTEIPAKSAAANLCADKLATKHTHRPVFALLEQFIGRSLQAERKSTNRWCFGCLGRANDYDLAMDTASKREAELIQLFECGTRAGRTATTFVEPELCELDDEIVLLVTTDDGALVDSEAKPEAEAEAEEEELAAYSTELQVEWQLSEEADDADDVNAEDGETDVFPVSEHEEEEEAEEEENLVYSELQSNCGEFEPDQETTEMYLSDATEEANEENQRITYTINDVEDVQPQTKPTRQSRSAAPIPASDGSKTDLFKCDRCAKFFETNTAYKVHINACKTACKKFTCAECGYVATSLSALKIHVAQHNGISPSECSICGRQFSQRGALLRHMPLHTGEKPYQCDKCGKQFIHYSSFHMHKLAHDDVRDKQCTVCGLELRSSSHLTRHMRIHSGEKPYACPTCGQKFAQRYNMMTHYKTHQGIHRTSKRTYRCVVCDQRCEKASDLRTHHTTKHTADEMRAAKQKAAGARRPTYLADKPLAERQPTEEEELLEEVTEELVEHAIKQDVELITAEDYEAILS